MIINVCKNDIRYGVPGDCYNCAIARRLKKQFKTQDVCVTADTVRIDQKYFITTVKMKKFIDRFDDDKNNVKPTSFLLLKSNV